MDAATPTLACVVPATDGPATLERCLEAIAASAEPPDELVVVAEPSGAGPAAARNAGVRSSEAELIVFVDADVVVSPDAFARVRSAFAADPGLGAIFGAYDDDPEATGAVSTFRNLLHHRVHVAGAGPATTFWAGLGAVRRRAFDRAGGFNAARYPRPSVEDIELGMRLAENGEAIRLDPAIQGKHLKEWTLASMTRTDFADRGVPWARLMLERGGPSTALNLGWRHRAGAAASALVIVSLLRRRPLAAGLALAGLAALNVDLYRLLLARRGARALPAGLAAHVVHHATGVAAAGAAAAGHNGSSKPA
ncbi:MAG: glycosyltransferase family 2 protein [Solirubrobacterales bacterium]|nr:glycosyltransferase family 2 protein [Solirubrobacterales bacterium]